MDRSESGDGKLAGLRAHHALNPRPEAVTDETFVSGDRFFDARDLVQVKYEMLRRVRKEGQSVTRATKAFGLSRPSFYVARAAFEHEGLPGLLPERPGPRGAHKLTEQVLDFLEGMRAGEPSLRTGQLAGMVKERFGLSVHPRSIERRLRRRAQKNAPGGKCNGADIGCRRS